MENMNKGVDIKDNLINELLQGIEFAEELRNHFMDPSSSNPLSSLSDEKLASNSILLEKMLSIFDKSISIAKLLNINKDPFTNLNDNNYGRLESPHSLTLSSPKSENSHPNFPPSKRRRSMTPKWSKIVKVSNEEGVSSGLERTLNDGFSWRKYGQKEILGAKFPRGYYRCTHRFSQGCEANRQVQRSDEDPSIYQLMYRGEHTCNQGAQLKKAQSKSNSNMPVQINSKPQQTPSPQQEIYVGLGPNGNLKVEPEQDLNVNQAKAQAQIFRCFSFTQAHQLEPIDDNYMLGFCTGFGSPTTSESNCLPMSPYHATLGHVGLTVQTSETDVNNSSSGPNSVTNSPVCDFEFPINELLDFGGNFSLFDFGLP